MAQLSVYLLSCGCMQDVELLHVVFNRVCLNLDCKTNQYTECALAFVNYWSTTHFTTSIIYNRVCSKILFLILHVRYNSK